MPARWHASAADEYLRGYGDVAESPIARLHREELREALPWYSQLWRRALSEAAFGIPEVAGWQVGVPRTFGEKVAAGIGSATGFLASLFATGGGAALARLGLRGVTRLGARLAARRAGLRGARAIAQRVARTATQFAAREAIRQAGAEAFGRPEYLEAGMGFSPLGLAQAAGTGAVLGALHPPFAAAGGRLAQRIAAARGLSPQQTLRAIRAGQYISSSFGLGALFPALSVAERMARGLPPPSTEDLVADAVVGSAIDVIQGLTGVAMRRARPALRRLRPPQPARLAERVRPLGVPELALAAREERPIGAPKRPRLPGMEEEVQVRLFGAITPRERTYRRVLEHYKATLEDARKAQAEWQKKFPEKAKEVGDWLATKTEEYEKFRREFADSLDREAKPPRATPLIEAAARAQSELKGLQFRTYYDRLSPAAKKEYEEWIKRTNEAKTPEERKQAAAIARWILENNALVGQRDLFERKPPKTAEEITEAAWKTIKRRTKLDVRDVPIDEIGVRPDVMQFKIYEGPEGLTGRFPPGTEFLPGTGSPPTVLELTRPDPQSGKKYVIVDGHQRLHLAKSAGEETLEVRVLKESEGVTPEVARTFGIIANLLDDTANAIEVARAWNEIEPILEKLKGAGIDVKRSLLTTARGIANLAPDLVDDIRRGVLPETYGGVIGNVIPADKPVLQRAAARVLLKNRPPTAPNQLRLARLQVQAVLAAGEAIPETKQKGLFADDRSVAVVDEQAKLVDELLKRIRRDKRAFAALTRNAQRYEQTGAARVERDIAAGEEKAAAQARFVIEKLVGYRGEEGDVGWLAQRAAQAVAAKPEDKALRERVLGVLEDAVKKAGETFDPARRTGLTETDRAEFRARMEEAITPGAPKGRRVEERPRPTAEVEPTISPEKQDELARSKQRIELIAQLREECSRLAATRNLDTDVAARRAYERASEMIGYLEATGATDRESLERAEQALARVEQLLFPEGYAHEAQATLKFLANSAIVFNRRLAELERDPRLAGEKPEIAQRRRLLLEIARDIRDVRAGRKELKARELFDRIDATEDYVRLLERQLETQTREPRAARRPDRRERAPERAPEPGAERRPGVGRVGAVEPRAVAAGEPAGPAEVGSLVVQPEGRPGRPGDIRRGLPVARLRPKNVSWVRGEKWKGIAPEDPPTGIEPEVWRDELTGDQRDGIEILRRSKEKGAMVADGTGVGKTRQMLGIAKHHAAEGLSVLIIAPSDRVVQGWQEDFKAMRVQPRIYKRGQPPPAKGEIAVITYGRFIRMAPEYNHKVADVLLFDEADYLKNFKEEGYVKRAKAGVQSARNAKRVYVFTATPADKPNHYLPYLAIADKLTPAELEKIGLRVDKNGNVRQVARGKDIQQRVAEYARNLAERGLLVRREISLGDAKIELHAEPGDPSKVDRNQRMAAELRAAGTAGEVILNYLRYYGEDARLEKVWAEARRQLEAGNSVVIACLGRKEGHARYYVRRPDGERVPIKVAAGGYRSALKTLANWAKDAGYDPLVLSGEHKLQDADYHAFRTGQRRLLVMTYKAGGRGISLDPRAGQHVVLLITGIDWEGQHLVQVFGRFSRRVTTGTWEVKIYGDPGNEGEAAAMRVLADKLRVLGGTIGGDIERFGLAKKLEKAVAREEKPPEPTERPTPETRKPEPPIGAVDQPAPVGREPAEPQTPSPGEPPPKSPPAQPPPEERPPRREKPGWLQYEEMLERQDEAVRRAAEEWRKQTIVDKVLHNFWDSSAPMRRRLIKALGERAEPFLMNWELASGWFGEYDQRASELEARIFKGLTADQIKRLNRLAQARRTIEVEEIMRERGKEIKSPEGLGADEARDFIRHAESTWTDYALLSARADEANKAWHEMVDRMVESGEITEEFAEELHTTHPHYARRLFVQHALLGPVERRYRTAAGQELRVDWSGIVPLAEGSENYLVNDLRLLLYETLRVRTAREFKQRALKPLWEIADLPETSSFLKRIKGRARRTRYGWEPPKAPPGWEVLGLRIQGEQKWLMMPDFLAHSLALMDLPMTTAFSKFISWASGAQIVRPLAVGWNWGWALANPPRDILQAIFTTPEYSASLTKALARMASDLKATARDAWKLGDPTPPVRAFIEAGGELVWMTRQGRAGFTRGEFKVAEKTLWDKWQDFMGWFGTRSERWTRLAVMRRVLVHQIPGGEKLTFEALVKKATPEQLKRAVVAAKRIAHYGVAGAYVKAIDRAVPFFAATMAVTRAMARAAVKDPRRFAALTAQLTFASMLMAVLNRLLNPEGWDELSEREKAQSFLVFLPWSRVDERGEIRQRYLRVRLNEAQQPWHAWATAVVDWYFTGRVPLQRVRMAVGEVFPYATLARLLPPTLAALVTYTSNRDTWTGRTVWARGDVEFKEEYYRNTAMWARYLARLTGLSPARTEAAARKIFPSNPITALGGGAFHAMLAAVDRETRDYITVQLDRGLLSFPGIRRFVRETLPYRVPEVFEEIPRRARTERLRRTREVERIVAEYYRAEKAGDTSRQRELLSEFRLILSQVPDYERRRLLRLARTRSEDIRLGVTSRWRQLRTMSPEARAQAIWAWYQRANDRERKYIVRMVRTVPGIATERFVAELRRLRATGGAPVVTGP